METKQKKRGLKPRHIVALVVGIVLAAALAMLIYLPYMMLDGMVERHVDFRELYAPEDFGVEATELQFVTSDGLNIAAWEVETENPRAVMIYLSGIHNPSVTAFFGHAAMLRDEGFAGILVEMRAHGASEGDIISLGMTEYLDAQAAVQYIRSETKYDGVPIVVLGLSMGAGTAINAIGETPEIDALITLSAFSTWQDVFHDSMIMMGYPRFFAAIERPFVSLYMGMKYGFDKLRINPLDELEKLDGRPALIMHSRGDTQVPFASFERIMEKLEGAPSIDTYVIDGDYHLICNDQFLEPWENTEYSDALIGFLNKHF